MAVGNGEYVIDKRFNMGDVEGRPAPINYGLVNKWRDRSELTIIVLHFAPLL